MKAYAFTVTLRTKKELNAPFFWDLSRLSAELYKAELCTGRHRQLYVILSGRLEFTPITPPIAPVTARSKSFLKENTVELNITPPEPEKTELQSIAEAFAELMK